MGATERRETEKEMELALREGLSIGVLVHGVHAPPYEHRGASIETPPTLNRAYEPRG